MLNIRPLSNTYIAYILCLGLVCSFLNGVFQRAEVLNANEVQLTKFLFMVCGFLWPKKLGLLPNHKDFPVFFSRSFIA